MLTAINHSIVIDKKASKTQKKFILQVPFFHQNLLKLFLYLL